MHSVGMEQKEIAPEQKTRPGTQGELCICYVGSLDFFHLKKKRGGAAKAVIQHFFYLESSPR